MSNPKYGDAVADVLTPLKEKDLLAVFIVKNTARMKQSRLRFIVDKHKLFKHLGIIGQIRNAGVGHDAVLSVKNRRKRTYISCSRQNRP